MNPKEAAQIIFHPRETLQNRARKQLIEDPLEAKKQLDTEYAKDFRNCPELKDLEDSDFPEEVELTPDGQRRFGKKRGYTLKESYSIGADNLFTLTEAACDLPIKRVIDWAFSADNWNREEDQINDLMDLMMEKSEDLRKIVLKKNGKLVLIGRREIREDKAELFKSYPLFHQFLLDLEKETESNTGKMIGVAFDFSGQDQDMRSHDKAHEEGFNQRYDGDILLNPGERVKVTTNEQVWSYRDGEGRLKATNLGIRTGENLTLINGQLIAHTSDVGWINGKHTCWAFSEKEFPLYGLQDFAISIQQYALSEKREGK